MNNKIIGFVALLVSGIAAIAYSFIVEGATGGFGMFLSIPSFIFVIGVGGGLNLMKKHTFNEDELGKSLRNDLALAGWLGFIVGSILAFGGNSGSIADIPSAYFSAAIIPVLYGYVIGAIAEAFMTN